MSNKKALEEHRRFIAGLTPKGASSGIKQTFEKAAKGQKIMMYKGKCPVCGEPLYPGFAVRCSICKGAIFHPGCFGTHTMVVHSPISATVILVATDVEDVWHYVDAEFERVEESTPPAVVQEEVIHAGASSIPEPEDEPAVVATTDDENTKDVRSQKTARTKKRTRTE
jgi:hypothetical protein